MLIKKATAEKALFVELKTCVAKIPWMQILNLFKLSK